MRHRLAHRSPPGIVATRFHGPFPDSEFPSQESGLRSWRPSAPGLRIESAIYLPAFAFNLANAVIIGNLIGEEKKEEAFKSGMVTAFIGVVIITGMVVAVILNARWIASLLSENAMVIEEAKKYLYISMLSEPIMAWGIILAGGLNGAGDTRECPAEGCPERMDCENSTLLSLCRLARFWGCLRLVDDEPVPMVQAFLISKRYLSRRWLQEMNLSQIVSIRVAIGTTNYP